MSRNLYLDLTFNDLAGECSRRATELQAAQQRSPEARRYLADDTALLLIAIASRLSAVTSPNMPESPAKDLADGSAMPDAYTEWAELQARRARHFALDLATERMLGASPRPWYLDERLHERPVVDVATDSSTGLRAALQRLEDKASARAR